MNHQTITQAHVDLLAKAYTLATTGSTADFDLQNLEVGDDIFAQTFESLENFEHASQTKWSVSGEVEKMEVENCSVSHWAEMQAAKGERRKSLTVIDLGDFRLTFRI